VALDPSRQWLAAGITGLARSREWDAVVTAAAPGAEGDEIELVVLADGTVVAERSTVAVDPGPLVTALAEAIVPPYRALGVRRPELWVVGAVSIATVELADDVRGDEIEVVRDAAGVNVRLDARPAAEQVPELERLGEARAASYVVRARRLAGRTFEVEVEAL
jgi:hypothetical protein